jgi:hypothetical protein
VPKSNLPLLNLPLPPDLPKGPLDVVMGIVPSTTANAVGEMAGRWRTYFPTEFDLDNALHEIRQGCRSWPRWQVMPPSTFAFAKNL